MVQNIAQDIICQAKEKQAQDIYFIPKENSYELYMRIGDERRFIQQYAFEKMAAVISHFKFTAGMNVGEKRRSQLGSCDYQYRDKKTSLRLSTVGDYRGYESLVIRLLHDEKAELKFWFAQIPELKGRLKQRGLYLFSGPVGSGKTTLMHQLAQERFADEQIMSIEDPVEIKQDRMLQLQLNEAIGLTYESLIKLSLRHRPDLLIIGKIRDTETARGGWTSQLDRSDGLFNDSCKSVRGVYERLLELGVTEAELKIVLQGICYQRLIAKGGIVDFVSERYQEHDPSEWNRQIDQLYAAGHINLEQAKAEKIIHS